ncbi:MAG: sterol desaturase family protein [Bacteroidetes bacterium]|nr:sterol desaturase family protein [Bacteroidota bacterium]
MLILIEKFGYVPAWMASATLIFLRYLIMAGFLFFLFYYIRPAKIKKWKIQKSFPSAKKVWSEIGHSLMSALVFALFGLILALLRKHGFTAIYTDISLYGYGWLPLSFLLLFLIHDTYFYWMHRLLHRPPFFKIMHKVHHQSFNPTPWAAMSFHPLEAVLEIAIIPITALLLPMHPGVLIAFAFWSLIWNVLGHGGYELFPSGFVKHPIFKWVNTATHHNMHHLKSRGNYGLYFNFWDRIMGTNFPDYEETFEAVKRRAGASANGQSIQRNIHRKSA